MMDDFTLSQEELQTLEVYARVGKNWNATHPNLKYWEDVFLLFKRFLPRGRVIDIGCGAGRDAQLFVPLRRYSYVGIDASKEMLKAAHKLVPRGKFQCMNMYALHFPKAHFDGFWAVASLIHIPRDKIQLVLQQIKNVVRSGGIGLFVMEEGSGEYMKKDGTEGKISRLFVRYGAEEFKTVLETAGFHTFDMYFDSREHFVGKENPKTWVLYFVKVI